jgi:hypothetical protein
LAFQPERKCQKLGKVTEITSGTLSAGDIDFHRDRR